MGLRVEPRGTPILVKLDDRRSLLYMILNTTATKEQFKSIMGSLTEGK